MALAVAEERRSVTRQLVGLERAERKREAVVAADQGGQVFDQPLRQPFPDTSAGLECLLGPGGGRASSGAFGPIPQ
jgi:hypothetical protein